MLRYHDLCVNHKILIKLYIDRKNFDIDNYLHIVYTTYDALRCLLRIFIIIMKYCFLEHNMQDCA